MTFYYFEYFYGLLLFFSKVINIILIIYVSRETYVIDM